MTIVLPALGVAFAAFCVWLTVRIVNRRERWAKWTLATIIAVPLLYVLSFGPWCWISSRLSGEPRWIPLAYRPVTSIAAKASLTRRTLNWYAQILAPDGWGLVWMPHGDIYDWVWAQWYW